MILGVFIFSVTQEELKCYAQEPGAVCLCINHHAFVLADWMSSIPNPGKVDQLLSIQRDCCDRIQSSWLS